MTSEAIINKQKKPIMSTDLYRLLKENMFCAPSAQSWPVKPDEEVSVDFHTPAREGSVEKKNKKKVLFSKKTS